jgi:hypothetical protein
MNLPTRSWLSELAADDVPMIWVSEITQAFTFGPSLTFISARRASGQHPGMQYHVFCLPRQMRWSLLPLWHP